jgi:pimeloyl-ACP methyl ester carboxylesterase
VAFFAAPDGVRLHYEIAGDGPPLVLHLGAGCDYGLWNAAGYTSPLSETNTCVLFDHRGHGQSDHPVEVEANHIDRYAEDVIALLDHIGHSRASFFGWSNAVVVALRAAARHPSRFESLVLFGPIAPQATPAQVQAGAERRVEALREKGWWYLLDEMLPAERHPVPQWMVDRILATDIDPYIAWSRARPLWDWSPWEALPMVGAPTLWIVGELEDPDDSMAEAASMMPNARRVRVPEKEHINAFLDSPFVLPFVTEFLGEARSR